MQGVARNFFTLAIIYAICGMVLGLSMAISQDHSQMPTHAHIMVAGWVMSAVFAFFYHLVPAARASRLAQVHFWLTAVSGIGLVGGLFIMLGGNPSIEPIVATSSMVFFAATAAFRLDRADGDVEGREPPPRPSRRRVEDKLFRGVNRSLSFTGVYCVHPVIWILTEWLEPLRLTPPC